MANQQESQLTCPAFNFSSCLWGGWMLFWTAAPTITVKCQTPLRASSFSFCVWLRGLHFRARAWKAAVLDAGTRNTTLGQDPQLPVTSGVPRAGRSSAPTSGFTFSMCFSQKESKAEYAKGSIPMYVYLYKWQINLHFYIVGLRDGITFTGGLYSSTRKYQLSFRPHLKRNT